MSDEWVSDCGSGLMMNGLMSEWVNEWVSNISIKWVNELMSEWVGE